MEVYWSAVELRDALFLLAGVLLGLLIAFILGRRRSRRYDQTHDALLQATRESARLEQALADQQARHEERLADLRVAREQLGTEFQALASQVLEQKGQAFAAAGQQAMATLLTPFREQIHQFQRRLNEVHDTAVRDNASLAEQIRSVAQAGVRISAEANNLTRALMGDNKTLGNWGEHLLEQTLQLAGLMPDDHYQTQQGYRDDQGNRRHPDVVIKLPDGKHLVIDSKVSLRDYERAVAAGTDQERDSALTDHARAVRRHIDDLAGKDYSALPGLRSPGFVLMFIPVEPAYMQALRHDRDVFNYGYHRNVILVSHTTLLPIMRTVANVWAMARTNDEARELGQRAADIYNQVVLVAERLKRLGATLETASRQYNDTVRAVAGQQGLYGKVERFSTLSSRANKQLPDIQPMHADVDHERLELAVRPDDGTDKAG